MAARAVSDHDFWWHLQTGKLILENHRVFHSDPYSFTRQAQPWVNHEWLSEVLIYSVYRATGWAGLMIFFGAVIGVTLLLMYLRCAGRPYIAALVTLRGAFIFAPTWGVRPHTLSLLLASVFLLILEKSATRPKVLWWLAPLSVLWVNLHAEYALGVVLLILFLLGTGLDVAFGFEPWREKKPQLKILVAVTLACIALVPLNPNGTRMYWYPLETLRSGAMQKYIEEWFSPNFHDASYLPLALVIMAIVGALSVSSSRVRPRELLLLLVTLAAALHSVRHSGIFALVAVPVLSRLLQSIAQERRWNFGGRAAPPGTAKLLVNALILAGCVSLGAARIYFVVRQQPQKENDEFPAAAVAYLEGHHPPGPILNHYNWGGYLIWKLYPEYPVYIDGRADLFGDAFLDDFADTYYVRTDHWQRELERWKIQTVMLPPDAPLVTVLRLRPDWAQIYADRQVAILTRVQEGPPPNSR